MTAPRPFAEAPRASLWPALGQLLRGGAGRYDLRRMYDRMAATDSAIVAQGRGRFSSATLFGPDANRHVLLDRDQIFSARQPWMAIMGTIFPNGLLLRDGLEHRRHRKIMHEAFTSPVLREVVGRMNDAIGAGIDGFRGRRRAFDAYKALTLDIAASTFVGVDLGPEASRMNEAFQAMVAAAMPGLRHPLPFGRHYRGVEGRRFMLSFLRGMLTKKRGDPGGDLFSRLCRARSETGLAFSDDEVLDHMVFLMMAAHDTTTSTLTSLTWELGRNPDWQERVREESLAFAAQPGFDELDRLESLTWAMRETLRRYPPLPVIPRTATRAFEWQGYEIPARTMVVLALIHTHHMPEWWDDPERWDPERFSPARAEHERHSHSWVPFGGGTHLCLGKRFGEAQVRLVMHQLLRRYRWRTPPGYEMPIQQAPISKPTDGLPLEFEPLA